MTPTQYQCDLRHGRHVLDGHVVIS
jgi:hypothetical protein